MSHALQTRKLFERHDHEDQMPKDNPLQREYGWSEVASGLGRVLLGYLLMLVSLVLLVIVAVVAVMVVGKNLAMGDARRISIGMMWFMLGGMGLVSIMSFASYVMILTGKIRCAVHAPERSGARWMIFMCILCLVVGPVLDFASGFIQADPGRIEVFQEKMMEEEFQLADHKLELLEIFGPKFLLALVGIIVAMLASVFFVLFFRAIGACFDEQRLIVAADYYLFYSVLLLSASGFMFWTIFTDQFDPFMAVLIMGGWLINLVWYVFLVFFTRCVILTYCQDFQRAAKEAAGGA